MKKGLFNIAIIFLVVACNNEHETEMNEKINFKQKESEMLANANRLFNEPDWQTGVSLDNSFSEDPYPGPSEFHTQYMQRFHHNNVEDVHWKVADNWIRKELGKITGEGYELTEEEKKISPDIQYVILDHINLTLLKESDSSEEIAKLLSDYYFPILRKHKAVDLDIMANALIFAKPHLSTIEYNDFRSFILEQGDKNLSYVKENWQKARDNYKTAKGEQKQAYLYQGKRMEQMTQERNHVRSLLNADSGVY